MKNVFVLLALVLLAGSAHGQCYNNYSYAPPVYHNVVTTYKEVLVPLFQPYPVFVDPRISYHYSSGNYLGVALAPSIPSVVGVPAQPVQAAPMMPAKAAAPAGQELDIGQLVEKIEKHIKERNSQQVYEPDGPPLVPGGVSYVAPKINSRSWVNVLQANCAMCHTGEKSKGQFVIFDAPGRVSATLDAAAVWDAISDGRMPPKERPRVKAADKEVLRRDFGI